MPQENLLPCPFCGEQPEWINQIIHDSHFYIRCPNGECHITIKADRRDKAIGFWNRRSELHQLKKKVEQQAAVLANIEKGAKRILEIHPRLEALDISHKELLRLLELVEGEWNTDPRSTQCFDSRIFVDTRKAIFAARIIRGVDLSPEPD